MTDEICSQTLSSLVAALDTKACTSAEATQACLERIENTNGVLGSFLQVEAESAMNAAKAADQRRQQGRPLSSLDGVPISLKDNLLTEGVPTQAASRILEDYRPPYDATVVKKLKDAGAVLLGKVNCDEFAMGSSNENSAYGVCKNPWNTAYSPGGSSGGSAASVASGQSFASLGTDTGGSVRQPAAFCGVVGLKPSYGRVSRFGVVAFASSLDQVGPISRDVRGCAMLLNAIAGHDARDATSVQTPVANYLDALQEDLDGLQVGIPQLESFADGLTPSVALALDDAKRALAAKGATLVDIELPHSQYAVATYYILASSEAASNLARYDGVRYGPRKGEENGLQSLYEETRGQLFGQEVKRRILLGNYVLSAGYYDAYYVRAQKVRRLIAQDFQQAFEKVDVILTPTSPTPAFRLGEKSDDPLQMYLSDIFTIQANLAGIPAISVPGAWTDEGLPLGIQLMAPAFGEEKLFRAAYGLESELQLESRKPLL